MTTSNTQPKWALIGVRVCAVYPALWAVAACGSIFMAVNNATFGWLQLFYMLGAVLLSLTAWGLWQLRSWSRVAITGIFASQIMVSIIGFLNLSNWTSRVLFVLCMLITIGAIGLFFITRPIVKEQFENQQSKIQNQKSPNA